MYQDNGDNALHIAVRSGNIELVKLLAEHGVSPNIQNVGISLYLAF